MALSSELLRPEDFSHRYITRAGLRMHLVEQGKPGAPLVILLHGFPDFWYGWHKQIGPLAEAGYYVVAPDQRGYNLTDKQGPYNLFTLTDDVVHLMEALNYDQAAAVVGHDWGGAVTWAFAARYPELVRRVAVCNVPHPYAVNHAITSLYWPQLLRSWYILAFQMPWLPEFLLSANHFEALANLLRASGLHDTFSEAEIDCYREAWAQPMAIPAMLGWYRAFIRDWQRVQNANFTVHRPALLLWGENDVALTKQTAEWSRDYVQNLTIRYLSGVSHWVQRDRPTEVNNFLLQFLGAAK